MASSLETDAKMESISLIDSSSHRAPHEFTNASQVYGLGSIQEENAVSGHLFEFEVAADADYIGNRCQDSDESTIRGHHRNIYGTLKDGVDSLNPSQGRSRISRVATMMGAWFTSSSLRQHSFYWCIVQARF
jgi:hypothetical protein